MSKSKNVVFTNFNVRQLQAYAALCLKAFGRSKKIEHPEIDKLVEHLLAVLVSENLPDWEQAGACMAITGRGDPLPQDVSNEVPRNCLTDFVHLLEHCVEVGLADMYAADSERPLEHLRACLTILFDSEIQPPISEVVNYDSIDQGHWGNPISAEEYYRITKTIGAK